MKLYLSIILQLSLILSTFAMEQSYINNRFFFAVYNDDENLIEKLINTDFDINTKDHDTGRTALMLTSSKKIAKKLLKHNAAVNIQDKNGDTALTLAAGSNRIVMVKKLLKYGAEINHKNNLGRSSLWIAAANGYFATVNVLLDNGADINAQDVAGQTPLMEATKRKNIRIVKMLLNKEKDIKVFVRNNSGQTALDIALSKNEIEIANLLSQAMKKRAEEMTKQF